MTAAPNDPNDPDDPDDRSPPHDSGGGADGGPLERLLARALEAMAIGETVDVTALCSEHPELRDAVAAALQQVEGLRHLHRAAQDLDPTLGDQLGGRYQLGERIGAGAMGVVYAGRDRQLGREVAIKVLRPDLVVGARMDARLAREAEVLAKIRHPNVVTVHDRGRADDGRSFLVLERLQGVTLAQLLRDETMAAQPLTMVARIARFRDVLGPLAVVGDSDVRLVVDWIVQAAAGVQAAHAAGVVHRDLKPSNLFLERAGRLVVLDFGIVSVGDHPTVGSDGSPLGTPAYMAPEQLRADAAPDVRSDVYGLASTLYHLLTGRAPYTGSLQQVFDALARSEPEPADRVRPGLPIDLVAVLEKGMARAAQDRYATVAAFAADLVAWREHRPVSARRRSWLHLAARRARRSPFVRALAVMLGVLVVTGVGWQWAQVRAAQREQADRAFWAALPPTLVNDPPRYRATSTMRHPDVDRFLAAWLAVAVEPFVPLAILAVHQADGGDLAAAGTTCRRLAELGDAPFAAAAAAAYEGGQRPDVFVGGDRGPSAGAAPDRLLLVLHAMRSEGAVPAWVEPLLAADPGQAGFMAFTELRLLLQHRRAFLLEDFDPKVVEYQRLEREALRWQAVHGPSTIVDAVLTNALLVQGRAAAARAVADRALALAPTDFALCVLAGSSAFDAGDAAAAVERLQQAVQLQPLSLHARCLLCDALVALGRFDEVERQVADPLFDSTEEAQMRRAEQLGLLAYEQALASPSAVADLAASEAERRALLARARAAFRRAREIEQSAAPSLQELVCAGLLGESIATSQLLERLAATPVDADLLDRVAQLLPKSLDEPATAALVRLLQSQATALGGRRR